jgi:hypothetical protein
MATTIVEVASHISINKKQQKANARLAIVSHENATKAFATLLATPTTSTTAIPMA